MNKWYKKTGTKEIDIYSCRGLLGDYIQGMQISNDKKDKIIGTIGIIGIIAMNIATISATIIKVINADWLAALGFLLFSGYAVYCIFYMPVKVENEINKKSMDK